MVCELAEFPVDPQDGTIPICEIDGKVHYSSPETVNLHLLTNTVASHPHVVITRDILNQTLRKPYEGGIFLSDTETFLQRLQDAWYDSGIIRVLEMLSESESGSVCIHQILAKYCLVAYNTFKKIKHTVWPSREEMVYREENHRLGPVLCISWHPSTTRLALATTDDSVSVFSTQSRITPVLKSKVQRRITCLAWRPLTGGELAVGCADGVNVWTVDTSSLVSRPSPTSALLLPHSYVNSIAWSPQGDILVSCNRLESGVVLWRVDSREKMFVPCVGGAALLLWNPSLSKLFSASAQQKTFRLWSTETWKNETWKVAGSRVSAATWSQDGSTLLFTASPLPFIYCVQSGRGLWTEPPPATIAADITLTSLHGSQHMVGGEVRALEWDSESRHLVVLFVSGRHLAVFLTTLGAALTILPGFLIKGFENEIPTAIAFQKDFAEGSNLTISWSTGRVQYFPMVFKRDLAQIRRRFSLFAN